jgi:hypothetical protein
MAPPDSVKTRVHSALQCMHVHDRAPQYLQSCDWQASTFDDSLAGLIEGPSESPRTLMSGRSLVLFVGVMVSRRLLIRRFFLSGPGEIS